MHLTFLRLQLRIQLDYLIYRSTKDVYESKNTTKPENALYFSQDFENIAINLTSALLSRDKRLCHSKALHHFAVVIGIHKTLFLR